MYVAVSARSRRRAQVGKGKVIHALLRKEESEHVVRLFRDHYSIPLVHADASKQFLDAFLLHQRPPVTIKSHHNLGGLSARIMKLVEPLRELFNDEVRGSQPAGRSGEQRHHQRGARHQRVTCDIVSKPPGMIEWE